MTEREPAEKYSKLSPAAPWPGGAVFTAEGPGGKIFILRAASKAEAGAAPFLSHPVLPVYVETVSLLNGGKENKFLVYEHFEGESAASILARGGTFSEFEALKTGYETARALKYLHALSPRVAHGAVSPASVFRCKNGRVLLCGCAAAGEIRADLKGFAGLLRALAAAPAGGRFSDSYFKMLEYLELPEIEAGHALKAVESIGSRPLFRIEVPPLKREKGKLPLYAWPLAAAVFFVIFSAAFSFRADVWPVWRAKRNIRQYTKLVQDFPCTLVPAPVSYPAIGANLVFNPGLEGPCGWQAYGGFKRGMIERGSSHGGIYYFTVKGPEDGIYQDVDISPFSGRIAGGGCRVKLSGFLRAGGSGADGEPYLYGYAMRSEDDYTYLSGFSPVNSDKWTRSSSEWPLPAGARKIRVFLMSFSRRGSLFSKKAYFDDISAEINCP